MKSSIQGLLLDMDGVLYIGDELIEGAAETLDELREMEIPLRFITNTTTRTQRDLMDKLGRLGLEAEEKEVFTAVTATREHLAAMDRPSCHLLVRESVLPEFSEFRQDDESPDVVVIGDIGANWTYDTLNRVFNMLMNGSQLICMHRNKYWQDPDGLRMDIGAFVAALEHVTGKEAVVIGKPAENFFKQGVASLGLETGEVAVVGDDIESDVGGAQACGLQGILCETGKYRPEAVQNSSVDPDHRIDSIAALPDFLKSLARRN